MPSLPHFSGGAAPDLLPMAGGGRPSFALLSLSVGDSAGPPRRPVARVSAPTARGRIVARGSAENPANRFERLAYAEDPEFVDGEPEEGREREPALRTRY